MAALIRLYKVPDKISLENNTLLTFDSGPERNAFFNSLPIKETILTNLSPHWKKQIWDIETSITIYQEGRRPLSEYNYMNINQDSFNHYYFITGYEEIGRNQVRYYIRKDTLNTYCSHSNGAYGVDIPNSQGLILRQHKDRFYNINGNLFPIFDKTIEKLDIYPTELRAMNVLEGSQRTKLVLKQFGGTVSGVDTEDYKILSTPKLFWEVFHTESKITYNDTSGSANFFELELGWGFNSYGDTTVRFEGGDNLTLLPLPDNYGFVFQEYLVTSVSGHYCISLLNLETGNSVDIHDYVDWNYPTDSFTYASGAMILETKYTVRKDFIIEVISSHSDLNIYYDLGITYKKSEFMKIAYFATIGSEISTKSDRKINLNSGAIEKVIELPYAPTNVKIGSNESAYIEILDKVEMNIENDSNIFKFNPNIYNEEYEEGERWVEDPKLLTSQFNPLFITWLGEMIILKRENFVIKTGIDFEIILNESDYSKARIDYNYDKVSNSYNFNEYGELARTLDLNNEITVIGSDLKRYIELQARNDIKLMQLQDAQAQRNLSKQRFSAISGAAVGAAGGFMVGNVGGAFVGALTGLALAGVNYSYALAQAQDDQRSRDLEYQNKMIALQNSAINFVGGSPEMNRLNNVDKIKFGNYEIKNEERSYVNDFFHYYGYQDLTINKIGPQSRVYFNYNEVVIDKLKCSINLTDAVREDIIKRFSNGVTRFYLNNGKFDFDQKYENWELFT